MARVNIPFLSFNRGLISPKALARVDLDRTRLSAEVMRNWLAKTQGAMTIRPGTKYFGSSHNDTGAAWIEFVAATDDVALPEITNDTGTGLGIMRIWLGSDPHALSLLERSPVNTAVSLSDTGWDDNSTGGIVGAGSAIDIIPNFIGITDNPASTGGVTVSASSQDIHEALGCVGALFDNNIASLWVDTGDNNSAVPSWINVDFDTGANGTDSKAITSYSIRATQFSAYLMRTPKSWRLITGDYDTGTYITDTGKWTLEDERSSETDWAVAEKRSYTLAGGDTGTIEARRHWRLYVTAAQSGGDGPVTFSEMEMFVAAAQQIKSESGGVTFNATSIGARAKYQKRVIVSDTGTEHSLDIHVSRGPIDLRVGSTLGDDDLISETSLNTGYHNLAFTPSSNFYITLQTTDIVDRIVDTLTIGDTGTVEITVPWTAADLNNIRYDQSADVVYVDCADHPPYKIERRGTGRSWSAVKNEPYLGPFLPTASTSAKLSVSHFYGNTTMNSDIPFFKSDHVGALVRIFHATQTGEWPLGALDAATDAVAITGISDTGTTPPADGTSERSITFLVTGTFSGTTTIERSVDGADVGFKPASSSIITASDTGSRNVTFVDKDDNIKVWYRLRVSSYTSGVAVATITYNGGGGVTGVARITDYNSNTDVDVEVLSRFSDTGASDNWQEGYWSGAQRYPTAVALHGGRLFHACGGTLFGSVSDDYQNYDDTTVGDAAPIIRTLGSGPVDNIYCLLSLIRLIIGTAGSELSLQTSSLDEPVTPTNCAARPFATNGVMNIRALKLDSNGIYVNRSTQRVYKVGFGTTAQNLGGYEGIDLTKLVPDLLAAGVVSIAVQRQPDTRLHCVLADGTVAILTYEPSEEVICWQTWTTGGSVEQAMVLPGVEEDAVYYHIRRTPGSGNDAYTTILLGFDGEDGATSFKNLDCNGYSYTWTAHGDAQIDTAESVFGPSSLLADGSGDYISTPYSSNFSLGTSDFTIDLWFNCTKAGAATTSLCGMTNAALSAAGSSFLLYRNVANTIWFVVSHASGWTTVYGTTEFTDAVNTGWHHVAAVRTGNVLKLFIDGVQEGGDVSFTGTVNDPGLGLGIAARASTGQSPWKGWIDEFRLSVGIARWTTDFTPPTTPYGRTKRFLEKWAKESECCGDTGLCWLADCAGSYTDTGRTNALTDIAAHLPNTEVVLWGDLDTGSYPFIDLSIDTGSDFSQTLYTVDTGGDITLSLSEGVHHAVCGLPYSAAWKSAKMAYGAQRGTALTMKKQIPQLGLSLYKTHNNGLYTGYDTGSSAIQPLPRVLDEGAAVDQDKIYNTKDQVPFASPGGWRSDARVTLRAKAPRPVTVLAIVPTEEMNEE